MEEDYKAGWAGSMSRAGGEFAAAMYIYIYVLEMRWLGKLTSLQTMKVWSEKIVSRSDVK